MVAAGVPRRSVAAKRPWHTWVNPLWVPLLYTIPSPRLHSQSGWQECDWWAKCPVINGLIRWRGAVPWPARLRPIRLGLSCQFDILYLCLGAKFNRIITPPAQEERVFKTLFIADPQRIGAPTERASPERTSAFHQMTIDKCTRETITSV